MAEVGAKKTCEFFDLSNQDTNAFAAVEASNDVVASVVQCRRYISSFEG